MKYVLILLASLLVVGCATGKYVGDYKDNKQHGQGTATYANGDVYVGEWKDGSENGQGTYTYADGLKYVGEWKDNLPWKGIEYDKDGNISVQFKEGVKSELS
jgi:hypothetical protein